jgi:hypothetical protein
MAFKRTNSAARIVGTTAALLSEGNLPANNAADPGETVTFDLGLKNIGATATLSNFTATLLPLGGVVEPKAVIGGVTALLPVFASDTHADAKRSQSARSCREPVPPIPSR